MRTVGWILGWLVFVMFTVAGSVCVVILKREGIDAPLLVRDGATVFNFIAGALFWALLTSRKQPS